MALLLEGLFVCGFGFLKYKVYHFAKSDKQMISEQECMKILNAGERKYGVEEVKQIRDLLTKLATIEFEDFKMKTNNKGN